MKKLLAVIAAGLMACAPSVANAATFLFTAQFQPEDPSDPGAVLDDTFRLDATLITEDEDFGDPVQYTAVSATGRLTSNVGQSGNIVGVEGDLLDFSFFEFLGGQLTFALDNNQTFFADFTISSGEFSGTASYGDAFGALTDLRLIQVADAGAVPEPAAWAMLIAGVGLTGAAMRRRRVRVAFA